jgi:5'-nucleotidase
MPDCALTRVTGYAARVRILLTNDDGIRAAGLLSLREALLELPGVEVEVIAPDSDRSAIARSITIGRPIALSEVTFSDGRVGYATDGTPVDCVRFASLGLISGFEADLVVAGINHGLNVGDDITYSGTVAAAWEGSVLGLPSIAVSQHVPPDRASLNGGTEFGEAARFAARLVAELDEDALQAGTVLNVNFPDGQIRGVEVTHLGKQMYLDRLTLVDDDSTRKGYLMYGETELSNDPGTDLAAVASGKVSITPLRFNLTDGPRVGALRTLDLERLLAPGG